MLSGVISSSSSSSIIFYVTEVIFMKVICNIYIYIYINRASDLYVHIYKFINIYILQITFINITSARSKIIELDEEEEIAPDNIRIYIRRDCYIRKHLII